MRFLTVAGLRRRSLVAVATLACLGGITGACSSDGQTDGGSTLGNVIAGGKPEPTAQTTTDGLGSVTTGTVIEGPSATTATEGTDAEKPAAAATQPADDAPQGSYLFDFMGIPRDAPQPAPATAPVDTSDPDAFPNLATVPPRPARPRNALERDDLTRGLEGDLENARHTDQDLRGGLEPEAAPPRPIAAAPDPLAGPSSGSSALDGLPPAEPAPVDAAPPLAEATPEPVAEPVPEPAPAPVEQAAAPAPADASSSYLSGSLLGGGRSSRGSLLSPGGGSYSSSLLAPQPAPAPPPPAPEIGTPVPDEPAPVAAPIGSSVAPAEGSDIGAPVDVAAPPIPALPDEPAAPLASDVGLPVTAPVVETPVVETPAAETPAALVPEPAPPAPAPLAASTEPAGFNPPPAPLAATVPEAIEPAAVVPESVAPEPVAPEPVAEMPPVDDPVAAARVQTQAPPPVGRTVQEITSDSFAASGAATLQPQVAMITGAEGGAVNTAPLAQGQPAAVINFVEGSNRLSPRDQERLQDAYLGYLRTAGRIRVVGRTGPGDGTDFDAFAVGLKRAEAVAQELIRLGVPADAVIVEAKPGEGRKAQVYVE